MTTLDVKAIDKALADLDGWVRAGDAITKEFVFDSFKDAIGFIVRVGDAAEEANHHPTLLNVYNRVKVTLSSHDVGAVTDRDLLLARTIQSLR